MLGKVKKMFEHPHGKKTSNEARPSLIWCPGCGKQGLPNCRVCRGEFDKEAREANLAAFLRRKAFADTEITALIGHIEYASPHVRQMLAETLSKVLANEFEAANKGKWTGDVALGLAAGSLFGDILDR